MVKAKAQRRASSAPARAAGRAGKSGGGTQLGGVAAHLGSGTGSVMNLPPEAVLQLQRSAGNAAVAQLVGGGPPVVQREEDGNPVVGLKRGDGLDFGTGNLKPRVSILQGKLNEKMSAGLNPDGMFGPRTGRALQDFAESVGQERVEKVNKVTGDLLMDRKGDEPPPPPPDNQFNEALEGRLDLVAMQYVTQLRHQNQGLVNLERDLRDEEKPNPTFLDKVRVFLLEKAAGKVIDGLLGGFASPGILFKSVMEAFLKSTGEKDDSVTASIADFGIDKVFEFLQEEITKAVKDELSAEGGSGRGSLELFVDAQRNAMFNATDLLLAEFSSTVKPRMRTLMPGPGDRQQDPATYRVERAQDLHIAVREGGADAGNKQYFKSLQQYAAYKAQTDLNPKDSQEEDLVDKGGTDMAKLADKDTSSNVRGILEVHIPDVDNDNAFQPIKVRALHIAGLAKRGREHINKNFADMTIGELGLPRRVWDGHDDSFFLPDIDKVEVMIGRNERGGKPTLIKADADGRTWISLRAGGAGLEAGLTFIMNEVDSIKISEIESKKGIEGPG